MRIKSLAAVLFCLCVALPLKGSDKEAFKKTKALAEKGDQQEQFFLGGMYAKGKGCLEDDGEAIRWYKKSAEQGFARAQLWLGVVYGDGVGTKKDLVVGYAWYNIATVNEYSGARLLKDTIAKKMTPEQITKAQELSKEMVKENPKLIKK
jgi:TPR repeat protein